LDRSVIPLHIRTVNKQIKIHAFKAGIRGKRISTHTWRKTFGREVWRRNNYSEASLIKLSLLFNHSSTAITRIYLDITREEVGDLYIANFDSYCNSLTTKSYRLDSDYLIFAYRMEGSKIEITNIWLKKVWEIAGPSGTYPLKVQEKKSIIYNIRPVIWYSTRSKFLPFNSKGEFLDALNETRYKYPKTHYTNAHWKRLVDENISEYKRLKP
jgi:hypothetical protein